MTGASTLLERASLVMKNLKMKVMTYCWDTTDMLEDTFCINAFDLFANPFIGTIPDTSFHGNHYELPESRARKVQLAETLGNTTNSTIRGRKPDRTVSTIIDDERYHVLLCEVKTEKASGDQGDLVKLGTMMKDCLDHILYQSYPRDLLFVVGILQQGQNCSLYILNSPYNYFYQMIEIFSCTTPSSSSNLSLLHDTIVLFNYARSLIDTSLSLLNQRDGFDVASDEDASDAFLTCKSPKTHDLYYTS